MQYKSIHAIQAVMSYYVNKEVPTMFYVLLPYVIGVSIFIGTFIFAGTLIDGPTCRDGWNSPSIGTQGACSHHGGIKYDPLRYAVFPSALFAGLLAWAFSSVIPFISRGSERYLKGGKTFCPKCNSTMRKKNGRYGEFFGCSKYPRCIATREINDIDGSSKRSELQSLEDTYQSTRENS